MFYTKIKEAKCYKIFATITTEQHTKTENIVNGLNPGVSVDRIV